ncbi:MAG: helix-turn-helix transcriptional regulator [Sphingomonadales bacterium]
MDTNQVKAKPQRNAFQRLLDRRENRQKLAAAGVAQAEIHGLRRRPGADCARVAAAARAIGVSLDEIYEVCGRQLSDDESDLCLADLLDKFDLDQQRVAEKCGVSKATISRLCHSATKPSVSIVEKIARGLNINLDDLIAALANRPPEPGRRVTGEEFRAAAKAADISINELAKRLGIAGRTLRRYLAGERDADPALRPKLAAITRSAGDDMLS